MVKEAPLDLQLIAISALCEYRVEDILPEIFKVIKKCSTDSTKIDALSAIGDLVSIEDVAYIPEIMAYTTHKQDTVRCQAVRAIANIGSNESLGFFTKMLKDKKGDRTLLAAVNGLVKLDKYESIEALEEIKTTTSGYHRDAIQWAISAIKEQNNK
jgi:hypothetical protein